MSIEKIQLSIFDIFAFVLPGIVVILSVWVIGDPSLIYVQDLLIALTKLSANDALVGGIIAYVIGFIINNFGYELHQRVGLKIWRISDTLNHAFHG